MEKPKIEEELLLAIYITNRRIYDVLALLLRNLDEESAETLMKIHEEGGFVTPELLMKVIHDESPDTTG